MNFRRHYASRWWTACIACLFINSLLGCGWVQYALNRSERGSARLAAQAEQAEEQGKSDLAIQLYDEALSTSPENSEYLRRCGQCLAKSKQYKQAIQRYQQANLIDPNHAEGYLELAKILMLQKRDSEADRILSQLLDVNANHTEGLLLKGQLAEKKQNSELAETIYYRVLNDVPDNIDAKLGLARLHIQSKQPEHAAPMLRDVIRNSSLDENKHNQASWMLGIAYGQQQEWELAASTLETALKTRSDVSADNWYRVAYAHQQSGNDITALESANKALLKDPAHVKARAIQTAISPNTSISQTASILPIGYSTGPLVPPSGW